MASICDISRRKSVHCLGKGEIASWRTPGAVPARVAEFSAAGKYEDFTRAVNALVGALGLAHPGSTRILVIVSDGRYKGTQQADGQKLITRLAAAQRNAAWRDVARRIAHEIKNPLTPIQLSAERLRRKYRGEITSDLETFDRCTDTIVRQVEDIGRMRRPVRMSAHSKMGKAKTRFATTRRLPERRRSQAIAPAAKSTG